MVEPLDVFTVNGESPEWLGCAQTLIQAFELVLERGEGSYFVFSHQTRNKSFYEVTSDRNISIRVSRCTITTSDSTCAKD